MTLLQRFSDFINNQQLFTQRDRLLLAVSGGIDSVVLCHLCYQAGHTFAIAHCHFSLRGEESNRDATFVKELAAGYGVPFYINHFDTKAYAATHKLSIQVAARELRYQWFYEIVNGQWAMKAGNGKRKTLYLTIHDSRLTIDDLPLTTYHSLLLLRLITWMTILKQY